MGLPAPLRCGLSRTTLALITTRRERKRPEESLCHPPFPPARGNEATTFAPRPRALKRPVLPPSRVPPDLDPTPIWRGSPPAFRTANSTCFKNGWVRGFGRAPRLRDRPGLTRKFSLSSLTMTRRLTSERARTRAAEHWSRQIASTRMMANRQRDSSSTHIASAVARTIEIHQESSEGGTCTPFHSAVQTPPQGAKTNVQTNPLRPQGARIEDPLYLALLIGRESFDISSIFVAPLC